MNETTTSLILPHHVAHLAESGIDVPTALANGIYSETDSKKTAVSLGWKSATRLGPCLMFPVRRLDGSVAYTRLRPDRPRKRANDGKAIKYESPRGVTQSPFFPAGIDDALNDTSAELVITEGEKKAICCTANGFPCIGLTGVHGWKVKDRHELTPGLREITWKDRQVRICFDSDLADNEQVLSAESQLAEALTHQGAIVKVARLPAADDGSKQGADDFIVAKGARAFRQVLDEAVDPEPIDAMVCRGSLASENPEDVADAYIENQKRDGILTLRNWNGTFYKYHHGRYEELAPADVKNDLVRELQNVYRKIKSGDVTNVLMNVAAKCAVLSLRVPPVWLDGGDESARTWNPEDTFATRSHLINLRLLAERDPAAIVPTTPAYFHFNATDYEFDPSAPKPERWLSFLDELWPDEPDSISLLKQWMGYLLTCDTRQQKILMLIGPRRSGKGTIARTVRTIVGDRNCCAPTLAQLGTNFGLSPLLGKSAAIIGDARLSGRTDVAATTERLLSISGEDAQTIDRKHRDPVTVKLPTRFTVISNELPRLNDASGALAGRMLILRLSRSFYGREDKTLSDQLDAERQGILLWAMQGWMELRQQGRFTQPESGNDLVEQMSDLASPISAFVRDCCRIAPESSSRLDDLYSEFREWSEASGVRVIPPVSHFSRDLTAAFPEVRRVRKRGERDGFHPSQEQRDRRVVCLTGISIA